MTEKRADSVEPLTTEPMGVPGAGEPLVLAEPRYLVWSGHRKMWYSVGAEPYTTEFLLAKRFSRADAIAFCHHMNKQWTEGGVPALPVPEQDFIETYSEDRKAS